MKMVVTILAILVLLMPIQPVFASINCMVMKSESVTTSYCKKMTGCPLRKQANKKAPNRSCDKKNCPMEACSSCYYTRINRPVFEVPYVLLKTQKIRLIDENILSSFIADCWHPPEFV